MKVEQLPGAHRPEGALSWLGELLGNGEARGVIVVAIGPDGDVDPRMFGRVNRGELAYTGALLSDHSVHGEFEPAEEEAE